MNGTVTPEQYTVWRRRFAMLQRDREACLFEWLASGRDTLAKVRLDTATHAVALALDAIESGDLRGVA